MVSPYATRVLTYLPNRDGISVRNKSHNSPNRDGISVRNKSHNLPNRDGISVRNNSHNLLT